MENIIGSNGASLTNVVRKNEESSHDPALPHDEDFVNAVSLSGKAYKDDTKLVHQIILRNFSKESNSCAYIESLILFRNGRRNFLALKER